MNDFWDINANVQIATALFLIVVLLMYISFKLSEKTRKPSKSSKR
jgi:K+-transporting ATPase A subunit